MRSPQPRLVNDVSCWHPRGRVPPLPTTKPQTTKRTCHMHVSVPGVLTNVLIVYRWHSQGAICCKWQVSYDFRGFQKQCQLATSWMYLQAASLTRHGPCSHFCLAGNTCSETVPLFPFANLPASSSSFTTTFEHQAGSSNEVRRFSPHL